MEKEWTFNQPTEEGFYWIEEGIKNFNIVKVKKSVFNEKLTVIFPEFASSTELVHIKGLKWYGPITPPPVTTIKEEINE